MKYTHSTAKNVGFLLPDQLIDLINAEQKRATQEKGIFISKSNLVGELLTEALAQRNQRSQS